MSAFFNQTGHLIIARFCVNLLSSVVIIFSVAVQSTSDFTNVSSPGANQLKTEMPLEYIKETKAVRNAISRPKQTFIYRDFTIKCFSFHPVAATGENRLVLDGRAVNWLGINSKSRLMPEQSQKKKKEGKIGCRYIYHSHSHIASERIVGKIPTI